MLFIENGKTLQHANKQTTLRMKYGHDNKDNACTEYRIDKLKTITNYWVITTGVWVHPRHPELACSPDGLVFDPTMGENKYGLVEIKCPALLQNNHPLEIQSCLNRQQLNNFCCKVEEGKLVL